MPWLSTSPHTDHLVWPLPNSLVSITENIHLLHYPSVQILVTLSSLGRSIKVGTISAAEQEKVAHFSVLGVHQVRSFQCGT